MNVCKCGQFTAVNNILCVDCIAEQNEVPRNCTNCGWLIPERGRKLYSGLCHSCFAESPEDPRGAAPVEQNRLRLFYADLEADDHPNRETPGFYVMVLAEDLEQAKVFVQAQFNIEYDGVFIDVFQEDVTVTEIEGPFKAGKVLCSLHY